METLQKRKTGFALAKHYEASMRAYLEQNVPCGLFGKIISGTQAQDYQGIDLLYTTDQSKKIGMRVRDCIGGRRHGDYSIRYSVPSGRETEIHSLRCGATDYAFMAWIDEQVDYDLTIITRGMLLDTKLMRALGMFEDGQLQHGGIHPDGVVWKYIAECRLYLHPGVIAWENSAQRTKAFDYRNGTLF